MEKSEKTAEKTAEKKSGFLERNNDIDQMLVKGEEVELRAVISPFIYWQSAARSARLFIMGGRRAMAGLASIWGRRLRKPRGLKRA